MVNAQLGQRGAIRKPLDVFSWVQVIRNLECTTDTDVKAFLNKWNNEYAAQDFKITGAKRLATERFPRRQELYCSTFACEMCWCHQ